MKLDRRRKPPIKSLVVKQSVTINGHHTSVSIEGAFWKALKEIAIAQNITAIRPRVLVGEGRVAIVTASALRASAWTSLRT